VSDDLSGVWSADPHTLAKHKILQQYLAAWMPILSRQSRSIIKYIDGFAGPGIYQGGEKGSPVLALETALNHSKDFPAPVELYFIENDDERFQTLMQQLALYREAIAQSKNVKLAKPIHGDCRTTIDQMIDESESRSTKFGPALVFLDQFGYSAVPLDLIKRILSHDQCEVLTYLFWRDLDRFITDPNKHKGISSAYGCEEWRPAIAMKPGERDRFMLRFYTQCLKDKAKASFVWPFAMLDQGERLLYWLFFCTNNIRGLEEMKRAMWKVDNTGGFTFSDKEGFGQLKFLTSYTEEQLEADMERGLAGKTLTVSEVAEWVLTETPHYKFKTALAGLERRGVAVPITPPTNRRPGTYPDAFMNMRIAFEASMFGLC